MRRDPNARGGNVRSRQVHCRRHIGSTDGTVTLWEMTSHRVGGADSLDGAIEVRLGEKSKINIEPVCLVQKRAERWPSLGP
jgi:hypothetical protein